MTERISVPPIEVVVPGTDPAAVTDDQDKAYNAWITRVVSEALEGAPEVVVVYSNGAVDRLARDAAGNLFSVSS